jgi:phosphatidylinositol alpha-1,6-mannosyltransferase
VAEKVKEIWPRQGHKTEVINPGVPAGVPNPDAAAIASLKSKYKLTGKTVLLTIGRLVKRKGMDKTIEALEALPEKLVDNLSYFIIGSGSAEGYLRELIPGKLSSKVTFLGELTADEKWDWLNLSDILIMPSRDIAGDFEGFGIVYLEANLCGKPVIAGDSGGVRDAVIDGYNGILVNPNDTAGIGQAIIKLALDSELRNKLGAQGKERTIKEFNWERQVEKLFKIIKG